VGIVLRWPIGLALISWRYLWRVTPVHRRDEEGDSGDLPPALMDGVGDDDVQGLAEGYGPLLHRSYAVHVTDARVGPEQVIARLAADPNSAAPEDAAVFVKATEAGPGADGAGSDTAMAVGDEYVVRMPGPWDGPVRVVHRTPSSFRFATLKGHLEAGQIEFRARCEGDELVFEIESWARPGDRVSHLLYNKLLLAKEIQLNLWTETCLGVARNSGGALRGGVRVHTRRVADPFETEAKGPGASQRA
jgi:hypothetical protein